MTGCVFGQMVVLNMRIHLWLQIVFVSVFFFTGFCDFEMDFCGWVNNPSTGSGMDWDWLSGATSGTLDPPKDHSTGSALGKSPQTCAQMSTSFGFLRSLKWRAWCWRQRRHSNLDYFHF